MKILLFTVFLFATLSLNAQYEKGNWYLNADAGQQAVVSPGFGDLLGSSLSGGYFLDNNLMIGSRLKFGSELDGHLTNQYYHVEPFVRYYLPTDRMRRLRYFAEVGAGLLFEDNLQTYLKGGVGAEYQLAPGIMATAGLRYNTGGRARVKGLTLDFGVNLVLGDLVGTKGSSIGDRKGTFMLDATVGELTFGKLGDIGLVSGTLAVNGGYFLTNKLLLEGGLSFSSGEVRLNPEGESLFGSNRFSASLGARYLFNKGKKFQPYLAAGLRYDRMNRFRKSEDQGRTVAGLTDGLSANLKAGFLYNFNNRVALDVNLGLNQNITGSEDLPRVFGGVGLKVFLGKR